MFYTAKLNISIAYHEYSISQILPLLKLQKPSNIISLFQRFLDYNKKQKTKTKKNTQNPEFHEEFQFSVSDKGLEKNSWILIQL